ncbi:MAG: LCP family protein [Anaerolineae bacterium]|nr:LCP family protein [Anaerolineae bacterium]
MATQTRNYKQPVISPFVAQGLVIGMMIAFLLGGAYTGYLFYWVVKDTVKDIASRTNFPTNIPYVDLSLPVGTIPLTGDGTLPIILPVNRGGEDGDTGATGVLLPDYEDKQRVNILLLGIDKRPDELYSRTDTMILVTVDPNTRTAGMLSVPRDLWVSVPGFGEDRVNKAYFLGDQFAYPGGGPALAMKTIQYNLGVPVHFYAQIDFQGFRDIVDTLGGIEIEVPQTIDDPLYPDNNYGYDPFYIEAGTHTLNGYDSLRYARTRATPGADFSRAKRQQQVLLAVRDKALRIGIVPKIPELWNTMSDTVETDLQLVDILELAQLADEIQGEDIQSEVIDFNYTVDYIVPDTGAQVLLPLREKIGVLIEEMFPETEPLEGTQPAQQDVVVVPEETAEAQARAAQIEQEAQRQQEIKTFLSQENASVVVQNGTSRSGLDTQTALYLRQQGFNIAQFGAADSSSYENTVLVVYDDSKSYTLEVLKTLFVIEEQNIRSSPNLKSDVDFRIIIGNDFELASNAQPVLTDDSE